MMALTVAGIYGLLEVVCKGLLFILINEEHIQNRLYSLWPEVITRYVQDTNNKCICFS